MTVSIVKVESEQIVVTPELIKRYICPNATDQELFMAASIAKSYGLNPFKREVHIIKYGNAPAQVVVGYEVYLKRAERTGKMDGWKVWTSPDGSKAFCTIRRKDQSTPFEWEVDRKEFDKGQANWKSMPNFMLKKVCIAQAFRICFPDEMGGLPYLPEEISGSSSEALPTHETKMLDPPAPPVSAPAGSVEEVGAVVSSDPVGPSPTVEKTTPQPAPTSTNAEKTLDEMKSEMAELSHIAVDQERYHQDGDAIQEWCSDDKFKSKCRSVEGLKKDWAIRKAYAKCIAEMNAPIDDLPV